MQEINGCSNRFSIKQSNSVTSARNRHYFTLRLNGLQEELSVVYVNETASKTARSGDISSHNPLIYLLCQASYHNCPIGVYHVFVIV